MAITGTYKFRGFDVQNTYLKVMFVTGNESGWNAQIGAFATADATDPLETFNKTTGYRAGIDPFGDFEELLLSENAGWVRVSPKRITRLEFLQRFTTDERVAIRTAAKNSVALEDYLALVDVATFVDVTRQDTIDGVKQLETLGLIAVGRAAQILA